MRIMIVDDHELVREGVRSSLARDPRLSIVGEASNAAEARRTIRQCLPDIALIDLRLPDALGTDLCREFVGKFPSTKSIILSTYLSEETVRNAVEAGAFDYVTKAAGLSALVGSIERIMRNENPRTLAEVPSLVQHLHVRVSDQMDTASPTPRQERVLELAAQGFTNQEIGDRLFVSEATVRFHMQNLKDKFSAKTKTELVAKAIRTGFIPPADEADVSHLT